MSDWRRRPRNTLPKIMERVEKQPGGCWVWKGFITPQGYGACGYRGRRHTLAHRAVYQELVGPIPDGLTLDHLCHTKDQACPGGNSCPHRRCVNPGHLEPVTFAENASRSVYARRTHCPWGHPYAGDNLRYTKNGGRFCVTCSRSRAVHQHRAAMADRPAGWMPKPRRRPTHCKYGHPFDETNTYVRPNGGHSCKTCIRKRTGEYRQRSAAKGAAA